MTFGRRSWQIAPYALGILITLALMGALLSTTPLVSGQSNSPATGAPTVSGTMEVGQTLSAEVSGIEDTDGIANAVFAYQWIRSDGTTDADILGAKGSTYFLLSDDEGKTIKVRVSFADDAGNDESLISTATATVEAALIPASPPSAPYMLAPVASHDSVVLTWHGNDFDDIAGYVILRWDIDDQAPGFVVLEQNTGTATRTYTDRSVEPDTRYIYRVKAINEDGEISRGSRVNHRVTKTPAGPNAGTDPGQIEEETTTWIGIDISPASIEEADYGQVTLAVTGVEAESNYSFRYDIVDDNGSDANACENWSGGTGLSTGDIGHVTIEVKISNHCPVGTYSLHVKWYKRNEDNKFEYGGTFTKDFQVIPDSDPPTDFERVDYITPLRPDPPASHGPLLMGFIYSPSPSRANVGIGIGGLVPDSDASTTDYVVSVRVVDEDNVPVEGCNQGPAVGGSLLIKTVPDSGSWTMRLGTLSRSCVSGLRLELLNGSFDYLLHKGGSDVWPVPRPPGTNSPATGVPVISGTARVGDTLTADTSGISDDDGFTNASFSYQWISSDGTMDTDIAGATGSTYTLSDTDAGKTIKVRVYFTDDGGNEETLTSTPTAAVAASVPSVPLSVEAEQGGTGELDVSWESPDSNGGSSITGYKVQWKGATESWNTPADVSEATTTHTAYTITSLSLGVEYSVRVVATNSTGDGPASAEVKETAEAQTSQQQVGTDNTPATGLPTISGTPEVGRTLFAETSGIDDADGIANAVFTYQWIRSDGTTDSDISGATGFSYILVPDDRDMTIKVRVSFTDDAGNYETLTSAATAAVKNPLTAEPQNVPESHDGSGTFTFRILFSEPVTASYSALKQDSFQVTNATIRRAQRVDGRNDLRKFTVRPSSDADVVLVLPVTEDCEDEGAICTSDGKTLFTRLEITVPGPASANSAPTGTPTISGTLEAGQTLTASTSGISDADGLTNATFSYQWLADDNAIGGATGSTYTLADGDEGKAIRVRVSFTDDGGNEETLTSAATVAVEARPNSPATGALTVTGTAQVGQTLTAGTSGISDADGLTNVAFGYQWLADDADILGATGGTCTLTETEEGKAIRVRVSFTDDGGNDEAMTSAATGAVSPSDQQEQEPAAEPTDRPHGLRASVSEGIVTLNWNAPDDPISVTMYRILRHRPEEGESGPLVYVDYTYSKENSYTDTAVEAGTLYVYSVQAADFLGFVGDASDPASVRVPRANSPATGAPAITGTPQVGETLTAGTSGISDADGLTNITYSYQWLADDVDIAGATSSAYVLTVADAGSTVKVGVSFTDDAGNPETLTSAATTAVTATVPGAPGSVEARLKVTGELYVSWLEPDSDGGADITSYTVQWKEASGGWDSATNVSETTTAETSHTVMGLSSEVRYTVRVAATNAVGDGPLSAEVRSAQPPLLERLRYFIENDVVEEHESNHPWLRSTWEYMQSDFDLRIRYSPFHFTGSVWNDCTRQEGLWKCRVEDMEIGARKTRELQLIAHEMGHVITLTNGIVDKPSALAAAHLYFNSLDIADTLGFCRPSELFADILELSVVGTDANQGHWDGIISYWEYCNGDYQVRQTDPLTEEAMAVAVDSVSGQMPQWFADTYQDPNGDTDLERLWNDVENVVGKKVRFVVAYALSEQFGGYCGSAQVTEVLDIEILSERVSNGEIRNPWKDGGCVPDAPGSIGIVPGAGQLELSWEAPDYDGGSRLLGYAVEWKSGDEDYHNSRRAVIDDPSARSHTVFGLTAGSEYALRVVAFNTFGDGEYSAEVAASPESPNSPATGKPTVTGTAQVREMLTADTSDIEDADGVTNASFAYQWLADDTEIAGAAGSAYVLASADEGKTIKVRVTFTDDAGNGETLTSDASSAVTPAPPPAPANLTATVNQDGSVTLSWDDPDDDSITGYQILRRRPPMGESTLEIYVDDTGSADTSYTDESVAAGVRHVYRIKAINSAGLSEESNYVRAEP